jgi:hypothetical protein
VRFSKNEVQTSVHGEDGDDDYPSRDEVGEEADFIGCEPAP